MNCGGFISIFVWNPLVLRNPEKTRQDLSLSLYVKLPVRNRNLGWAQNININVISLKPNCREFCNSNISNWDVLHMVPDQLDGRPVQHGSLVHGAVHRHSIHLQVQVTTGRATGWRLCRRAPGGPGPPQGDSYVSWLVGTEYLYISQMIPPPHPPHSLVSNPRHLTNPETCLYTYKYIRNPAFKLFFNRKKTQNMISIDTVAPSWSKLMNTLHATIQCWYKDWPPRISRSRPTFHIFNPNPEQNRRCVASEWVELNV